MLRGSQEISGLTSFTVAAFEGAFDAFFKVCQVQSMFLAVEVYLIPLS